MTWSGLGAKVADEDIIWEPQKTTLTGGRDTDGKWVKGRSGNPGGRPRTRGLAAQLRAKFGEDGKRLIDAVGSIALEPTVQPSVRLSALELMLAYQFGRPCQMQLTGMLVDPATVPLRIEIRDYTGDDEKG